MCVGGICSAVLACYSYTVTELQSIVMFDLRAACSSSLGDGREELCVSKASWTICSRRNFDHTSAWVDSMLVQKYLLCIFFSYETVQFVSVEGGIYVLEKDHMRSTLALRIFRNVALQTITIFV